MWFYWAVFTVLLLVTSLSLQYQNDSTKFSDQASLDSLSRSMLVYRSAVAEYAKQNPGYIGTPADSALALPSWFVKPSGVSAYLTAGQSYTFIAAPVVSGLPAALFERTESIAVGVNRSGILISPSSGQTSITIPSSIPEGAVVTVN